MTASTTGTIEGRYLSLESFEVLDEERLVIMAHEIINDIPIK